MNKKDFLEYIESDATARTLLDYKCLFGIIFDILEKNKLVENNQKQFEERFNKMKDKVIKQEIDNLSKEQIDEIKKFNELKKSPLYPFMKGMF